MPEVGDVAPDFELASNLEKGKKVRLSDFRGKNNVVLAFYPLPIREPRKTSSIGESGFSSKSRCTLRF